MAQTDRDLASIAEARSLARRAKAAAPVLAEFSQEQIDAIVDAMAAAVTPHAEALARLAHEETGYGVVADKVQKNLFASEKVYKFIRPMKTVGVIRRLEDRKVIEIAEPFGVVCAIVPTTNPTSTAIYKILISLKARCPIVISPHPSAVRCISRVAEIMDEAARRAGAPDGAINCMTTVTLEGTQELMKAREVAVILATGGMGLVRAAYSAGKPAYGVGPGNAPSLHRAHAPTCRRRSSTSSPARRSTTACSARPPNSVVVDGADRRRGQARVREERRLLHVGRRRATRSRTALLGPQRLPNPEARRPPGDRHRAGGRHQRPRRHARPHRRAERRRPRLSRCRSRSSRPSSPSTSSRDWKEGCERCIEILRYGGMGHTMSIHSRNDQIILEFGLKKPAGRIVVNTPTTHGSIGLTTGLDPAMTLGCGGWGGNITSDNISPRHLLNIKRLAYETTPAVVRPAAAPRRPAASAAAVGGRSAQAARAAAPCPGGIAADVLARRIDEFLASRGYRPPAVRPPPRRLPRQSRRPGTGVSTVAPQRQHLAVHEKPADFVCEDDVRQAIKQNRKIVIGERTIVTPAARDLGEQHRLFVQASWPR